MEKRFCPLIGRTIYIGQNHISVKENDSHADKASNPCACALKTGECPNYFSGCCSI